MNDHKDGRLKYWWRVTPWVFPYCPSDNEIIRGRLSDSFTASSKFGCPILFFSRAGDKLSQKLGRHL
jgi:hypothetical protein